MIVSAGTTYLPAPEGLHNAVCVDVVDLGLQDVIWQGKAKKQLKLRVVWELEAKMEDGRPFIAGKRYTASLHERSQLSKDLTIWRGRAFTVEERDGFELETIVGVPCQVQIVHIEKDSRIYDNIISITKADKQYKVKPTGDYVRVKDREQVTANDNDNPDTEEAGF